jgi:hypothetical protein
MYKVKMEKLLDINETAQTWCDAVIADQKAQSYTSLTAPHDLNHVIKSNIQCILDYLKEDNKKCMKDVDNMKVKQALDILLKYLRENETWKPSKENPLVDVQLEKAFEDLYIRCDRKFSDPPIRGQNYALYSFEPTKGATPDKHGLYGIIKIRGAFNRLEETEEKSKELIQYFSAHQIFVCEIGSPSPIQSEVKDKSKVIIVDNDESCLKYNDLIRDPSLKEKHQIEEIKQRTAELKADVALDPADLDPLEKYIMLNTKRGTMVPLFQENYRLYQQYYKNTVKIKDVIVKTRIEIKDMDEKHPDFKDKYMEIYNKTAKERGIDKATDDMAVLIKKYIATDSPIEGLDDI